MRASKSSSQSGFSCSILVVRSGAPGPLVSSQRSGTRLGTAETSCGNVAANPRRFCVVGDSGLYLAEWPVQTNGAATILSGRTNAAHLLVLPRNLAACTIADAALMRA